jgi:tRNA U34 2-thiouridine synthase MnmA/TrmU
MSFKSREHLLNTENVKIRSKNKVQPVKVYRGEELKALADNMGFAVSENAGRSGIDFNNMPESLKKFAPQARVK